MLLINYSPWPFMLAASISSMSLMISFNSMFHFSLVSISNLLILMTILINWNFSSNLNKMISGYKNIFINSTMKFLTVMFISSELMFFMSFFYIYYSNKHFNIYFYKKFYLSMFKLNFILALINLIILVTSSITFMIFIKTNTTCKTNNKFMFKTILLSIYFIFIQLVEYSYMKFNINNSIYFSMFYMLTGFHMTHVIMGTILMINIMVNKMWFLNSLFTKMMFTYWYWHFIDLIWIMIFFIIYYFMNMNLYI